MPRGDDEPKKAAPPAGLSAVVVPIADATRGIARQRRNRRADPPPADKRGEPPTLPGRWTPNHLGLPREEPCPVEPLGIEGGLYHLIDTARQLRSYKASDFSHAGIQSLFSGAPNYPQWAWPRYGRAPKAEPGEAPPPPPIKSFDDDAVRQALFLACDRKGLFSPAERMRGRGAWSLKGGQLVYHAGEDLWVCEHGRFACKDTGLLDGHLYPRLAALPAPWTEPIPPEQAPARALIETFRRWNWARPRIDPVLLLGWIGVAFLGAALDWRSAVLMLGDKGTGKSTLQQGLRDLFGDALFASGDTTAAGIYQRLGQDCRPVALDELEPDAGQAKVQAVIKLMRIAASGDQADRGGADHQGISFTLRSAFLFSAINNPLTRPQDLSRVAVLRLGRLDPGQAPPPPIDADTCGRMVLGTLMREWPRFAAARDAYMEALRHGGHDGRGQKTYGTLLAAADLLLGPELAAELDIPLDDLAWWTEHLAAESLPEVEDAMSNWRGCITHLLTAPVDVWRSGARITVGACLGDLDAEMQRGLDCQYGPDQARADLAKTGLGLLDPGALAEIGVPRDAGRILAVPNSSPLVAKLFEGSDWRAQGTAAGPWKDALRQAPDDIVVQDKRVNRVYIGGVRQRCSLIVLSRFHAAPER
ncbi:MAG: hypothetical protein HZA68_13035 [Rhodovulum sp.]|nr:hypothetical protein [Rhodovulum sp.]